MPGRRRLWVRLGAGLAGLALLAGLLHLAFHHFDPTRVLYKRAKAPDPYLYEEVDPRLLETDPASLIDTETVRDPGAKRAALRRTIWGSDPWPASLDATVVRIGRGDPLLPDLQDGIATERWQVFMNDRVWSTLYFLAAPRPRHRLVVYHHGFGEGMNAAAGFMNALLDAGYDVLVINTMGNVNNTLQIERIDGGKPLANVFFDLDLIDRPLRYHLEPVLGGLHHATRTRAYRSVDMVGFSMGAFVTALSAAVEPRIERSIPIAGVYPVYMRRGQEVMPHSLPYYPPLRAAASQPDLYVLGASGAGRSQLQIFNRYDRCCYNGIRGKVYEDAVRAAVAATPEGGRFAVAIDETHADHRISRHGTDLVLAELARGR